MEQIYYSNNNYEIHNAVETDEFLKIEGYCCHFNKMNLNREVVDEKSFSYFFSLYRDSKLTPRLNYNHTDTIIGGVDKIQVEYDGLYMYAHLNKNLPINNDMLIPNILAGDIRSLSTEGFVKGGYNGIVELENGYYVKDFVLTGVSVVSTPSDWDANFSISNFMKGYEEWKNEQVKKIYLFL